MLKYQRFLAQPSELFNYFYENFMKLLAQLVTVSLCAASLSACVEETVYTTGNPNVYYADVVPIQRVEHVHYRRHHETVVVNQGQAGVTPAAPVDYSAGQAGVTPSAPMDTSGQGGVTPSAPGSSGQSGSTPSAPVDVAQSGSTPSAPVDQGSSGSTPPPPSDQASAQATPAAPSGDSQQQTQDSSTSGSTPAAPG